MTTPRAMLVVPCYNEELRLDRQAYRQFVRAQSRVDLTFVNDGSRDGTLRVLEEMRAELGARVTVLDLSANGGKAEAVRQGVLSALSANYDYIGYWDADLATPLDVCNEWVDILEQRREMDWVYGARIRLLGRTIDRRPSRHVLGRIFASAASLALGLPVYDTQCGAKLFRRTDYAVTVFSEPFASRWVFDVEVLARILEEHRRTGSGRVFPVCEVPLQTWRDVSGSTLTLAQSFGAWMDLMHIWIKMRSGNSRAKEVAKNSVAPSHT